ncbi:unnamed protein product, partial [Owenia fusiformis]
NEVLSVFDHLTFLFTGQGILPWQHRDNTMATNATMVPRGPYKKPTKPRNHLCSICLKSFTQSNNLQYHMNIHTGHKPYKCTICPDVGFAAPGGLAQHNKKYH